MIMSGLSLLGDEEKALSNEEIRRRIPFRNVYFTGIIRDSIGRKMSKSLGNSPDPLDLIERYGADGVRMGLLSMAPNGQDILFSEDRVAQGKKLCTKLWNSFRFRQQGSMEGDRSSPAAIIGRIDSDSLEADDKAILGKLLETMDSFERAMTDYEFSRALQILHTFFWSDYCDWYIEISKMRANETVWAVHDLILRQLLLLFHPFIPFVTEELWQGHGYGTKFLSEELLESGDELRQKLFQIDFGKMAEWIEEVERIRELVVAVRALRAQFGLASRRDVKFYFKADLGAKEIIDRHRRDIKYLLLTQFFEETSEALQLPATVVTLGSIYVDMAGSLDLGAERERLGRELEQLDRLIEMNQKKLQNEDFLARAPQEVITGARNLLAENIAKREELEVVFLKLSAVS
jgi:valyl-tRNA synthetase